MTNGAAIGPAAGLRASTRAPATARERHAAGHPPVELGQVKGRALAFACEAVVHSRRP